MADMLKYYSGSGKRKLKADFSEDQHQILVLRLGSGCSL
jgi:hypothetical protein